MPMSRDPKEVAELLPKQVAEILYRHLETRTLLVNRVLKRIGNVIDYMEEHDVVLPPTDFEVIVTAFAVEIMHEGLVGEEMVRTALRRKEEVDRDTSNDGT